MASAALSLAHRLLDRRAAKPLGAEPARETAAAAAAPAPSKAPVMVTGTVPAVPGTSKLRGRAQPPPGSSKDALDRIVGVAVSSQGPQANPSDQFAFGEGDGDEEDDEELREPLQRASGGARSSGAAPSASSSAAPSATPSTSESAAPGYAARAAPTTGKRKHPKLPIVVVKAFVDAYFKFIAGVFVSLPGDPTANYTSTLNLTKETLIKGHAEYYRTDFAVARTYIEDSLRGVDWEALYNALCVQARQNVRTNLVGDILRVLAAYFVEKDVDPETMVEADRVSLVYNWLANAQLHFALLERLYTVTDRLAPYFTGDTPISRLAWWPAVALFLAPSPRLIRAIADRRAKVAAAGGGAAVAPPVADGRAHAFADGLPKTTKAPISSAISTALAKIGLDADTDELGRGVVNWSDVLDVGYDIAAKYVGWKRSNSAGQARHSASGSAMHQRMLLITDATTMRAAPLPTPRALFASPSGPFSGGTPAPFESSPRDVADSAVVLGSTALTAESLLAEASEMWEKLDMGVADFNSTADDMKKLVASMKGKDKLAVLRDAVALGKSKTPPVFFLVNEDNASIRCSAVADSDGGVDA